MSDTQQKIEAIKEKLIVIENEIAVCKKILRGEKP